MRAVGLMTILFVLAIPAGANAAPVGPITGEVPLRVNENKHRFDTPSRTIIVRSLTATFSVLVPKKAKHRHGVGIDGGPYRRINGATVRPGRESSLTVNLRPGERYTIYDSVGGNRKRGYYVKVIASRKPEAKFVAPGKPCASDTIFQSIVGFATGVSCGDALALGDKLDQRWHAANYGWSALTVSGFVCTFDPFGQWGLTKTCTADGRNVVFRRPSAMF